MANKVLRPCTIIPQSLYVKRSADRQVKQIIEDMGRPGYVLVARQMGKTNLLLNARREIASALDCFAYVDVSNSYPNLRDFFRNLIDVVLDSRAELLSNARATIEAQRAAESTYPAHKEHESELRIILKGLQGKLVICLDEIDSLTKTDYSDNVFAFIRSIYFSGRVNVPEFERLTYLLSGVAEPTELIKNKAISPFNIGAKIFLEDFSEEEFCAFIERANIKLNRLVVDRIFYWAAGHPRMSWDILSEIEDICLQGLEPTALTVDEVVNDLYLSQFDLPPIDNIRKLTEDDKEIRDAVISVHYNKDEAISDPTRMKLYLNGIVKSPKANSRIMIRNKILEEALSENWLRQIEEAQLPVYERGNAAYLRSSFDEAIDLYEQYLSSTDESDVRPFIYTRLGISLIETGKYDKALVFLRKEKIKKSESLSSYLSWQFHVGLALLLAEKVDESIATFEHVINESAGTEDRNFYLESLLNISVAYEKKLPESFDKIVDACNKVLLEVNTISTEIEKDLRSIRLICGAKVRLAHAYASLKQFDKAEQAMEEAIAIASDSLKIGLMVTFISTVRSGTRRLELLEEAVNIILENKLQILRTSPLNFLSFTEDAFSNLVFSLAKENKWSEIEKLISYLVENETDLLKIERIIYQIGFVRLAALGPKAIARLFFLVAHRFPEREDSSQRTDMLALAITIDSSLLNREVAENVRIALFEIRDTSLAFRNARAISTLVEHFVRNGELEKARIVLNSTAEKISNAEVDDILFFSSEGAWELLSSYLWLLWSGAANEIEMHRSEISKLAVLLNDYESLHPKGFFYPEEIDSIGQVLKNYRVRLPIQQVVRSHPKIKPNEIVTIRLRDGNIRSGKYKKLRTLLKTGEGELVTTLLQK